MSSDPSSQNTPPPPPGASDASDPSKRIVYQAETTGSRWGDYKAAISRLSPRDDLNRINEIPCARSSLLSGIASGVGVGFVRGMTSGVFVAANWAVGTFMLISLGTWTICQRNLVEERRRVQQVIESVPKRFVKKDEGVEGGSGEQKTA